METRSTEQQQRLRRLEVALQGVAAQEIPQLIAQARVLALDRVRDLLADAMTGALLERAETELRHPGRAQPRPRSEPAIEAVPPAPAEAPATHTRGTAENDEQLGLYVYCVVPTGTSPPAELAGIDPGHSPTLVEHAGLATLVSRVPLAEFGEERLREHLSDMEWLERAARTHEQVLEAVGDQSTLIPMRLCTIYRDESGVREMLQRERQALIEALEHLEAKSEWGVKVFAVPREDEEGAGSPQDAPPQGGTDYMRQRQKDRDRREQRYEHLHETCAGIHEQLSDAAVDALTTHPQRPGVSGHEGDMLLSGVYLVQDQRLSAFLDLVDRLREEHGPLGLELQSTGPWPAYNFVPGTIGAAW